MIEVKLLLKTIVSGLPDDPLPTDDAGDSDRPLAFAY